MNKRHLDVRGLEAPEPLEKILGELDSLKNDQQLEVTHWREPLLLYPVLEKKGWQHSTEYDEKTRVYLIRIWKGRL